LEQIRGADWVTRHFTHACPDRVALYFSVLAPGTPGPELAKWA
jgi:hypothetical protein